MRTLRIVNVTINDSSNIDIQFTDTLVTNLVTSNVSIIADTPNVPNSDVLSINVIGNSISITCQPLTPFATYFIKLQSVNLHPFISLHGEAKISEDGVSNQYLINGPLQADNPIRNFLNSYFKDNIYDIDDSQGLISKYLDSLSINLARALYDIRQVKNENYLSFTVIDEQKTRSAGPFDRLNEEGAYEVTRVGRAPTSSNASTIFRYDNFPTSPVTLQRKINVESLKADSVDENGKFNINSLVLNLSNKPVTKVNSIVFTFTTATPIYNYDIANLGYQIQNSRYDQDFGFSYLILKDNQIKINEKVLEDPEFALDSIFKIDVEYEVKDLGRVVNEDTVNVYTVESSVREVLPPIINIFNLKHAPIVNQNNTIPTLDAITFTDPNTNIAGAKHPAFLSEIPFRLNALPNMPGQYSVDYSTGTVYVYGNDLNNDGTGPYPPLATYKYRLTYKIEQDYAYDPDTMDLVALPTGNLINFDGNIAFDFEEVLIPGTDYIAGMHQESLEERINNQLSSLNVLKTQYSPITNVFRIFNETSGEIYTLDRWSNNKIYFKYNTPPNIIQQTGERVSFNNIVNELLFVDLTSINTSNLRIFKLLLKNNNIISSTEDSLGSFFNTSVNFSNIEIFQSERWFNGEIDEVSNIDNLDAIGQYIIDYENGIVYCAVSNTQDFNLGTVTYKNNEISLQHPHIISVDDIYYRISPLNPKNKKFGYTSFEDGFVQPETLDLSDELYLNGISTAIYQIHNNSVGIFESSDFIPGVTNQVNFVRGLFAHDDLVNSPHPLNFAISSTSDNFNIIVNPINKQFFDVVRHDTDGYFININENIPYFSSDIDYDITIARMSDSASLGISNKLPGEPVKIILSGLNSPNVGDTVSITYTFTINDLARVVVDYNKGDYYIDYAYVADEIIVSYEYGDNSLDFRKNTNLPADSTYYVSYKVGALRDALIKNFGTLVNVQGLISPDLNFNRERYRDALIAALTSFIQGPTVTAIKNIGKTISHIEPEIIESIFENWSLGNSILASEPISTTGAFQLAPAKYGNGALIDQQTVTFPASSNLRLEEGTFETWISPQWNGLDNDARLSFNILEDGVVIDSSKIFIGAAEFHPEITNGTFFLDKNSGASGIPNKNKDGVFIYYDKDISGDFNRWYVEVIDGYVTPSSAGYKFKILSEGTFYDNKSITYPKPSNMRMTTGTNSINFSITGGGSIDEGITFISDTDHYLLDVGEEKTKNRISIYKDVSGYLNFKVYDKTKTSFVISSDVSAWRANDLHHVAISWKLNTRNNRDEMHLFIDGFEVPNIIRYGTKLAPYLHEKFRTINPEEIIGSSDRDIVASVDLKTIAGATGVSSSLNFSSYNILAGDTIFIDEVGFDPLGYQIISVSGQTLVLDTPMPATLNDARFSINRTQYTVLSDIDTASNIAISTIHQFISGNDIFGNDGYNVVTSTGTNFSTSNVLPGFSLRIDNVNLNPTYTILQVNNNSLVLDGYLNTNIVNAGFRVYAHEENEIPGLRALRPSYSISKDGYYSNILTISNSIDAGDLILIRTLGLNHRNIKRDYYVWSDNETNVLMTRMPPPISLDEAKITRVILPSTNINSSNSTLIVDTYQSNNLLTAQPSNVQNGRTISVTINGNNVDFSSPVQVTINGVTGIYTVNETINFTDYGTLNFVNPYLSINYINVKVKPLNLNKNAVNVVVKEKYPITYSEFSGLVPVVKYSYHIGGGYHLAKDGYDSVRDETNIFSGLDIDNYLLIQSPITWAGFYKITGLSNDRKSLTIESTNTGFPLPVANFTDGYYQILNVNSYRSGFQNGFFTFEASNMPSEAYFLSTGFYELNYDTYTKISFDPINSNVYIGSNFEGRNQIDAVVDQVKIYSIMLTDTRIGESIPVNQRSITKDYNSLKALKKDSTTLMLLDFDTFPFVNTADFYTQPTTIKKHFQSSIVVNENFENSLVFLNEPLALSNDGILDTKKEGTIEFWMNPLFDTSNDPNTRFYFDAYGAVVEEVISTNNVSVKLSSPANQILSVKLKSGDSKIDYFAGGKIEIDTQHAISEERTSVSNNAVVVTKEILQVISVKIAGEFVGTDYFENGAIGTDKKTIYLGKLLPQNNLQLIVTYQTTENNNDTLNTQVIRLNKKLPYQKSTVIVNYIPKGLQGDRISIFKDQFGYMNFSIIASGIDYVVRAPTRWAKDTWHRVKASYKINGGNNTDEIRLFLDGYEFTNALFGTGIITNKFPVVMGSSMAGDGYRIINNIKFQDPINELFIGSQYTGEFPIFSIIDNFRISNISRPIYAPYGEALDVNYSSNLDIAFPVTEDLYTTYLLDFNSLLKINDDFAILQNKLTGQFDFIVNIHDDFDIVSSNVKSQEALETLIKVLKPSNSKVFIKYI